MKKASGKEPTIKEWAGDHPEFYNWWKKHRHSGFIEDNRGKFHWNTAPWEAWYCARYRAEFSAETGSPYTPPKVNSFEIEYSADEIDAWAKEQQEFLDQRGDEPITRDEFLRAFHKAAQLLSRKFMAASEEAKAA